MDKTNLQLNKSLGFILKTIEHEFKSQNEFINALLSCAFIIELYNQDELKTAKFEYNRIKSGGEWQVKIEKTTLEKIQELCNKYNIKKNLLFFIIANYIIENKIDIKKANSIGVKKFYTLFKSNVNLAANAIELDKIEHFAKKKKRLKAYYDKGV